MRDTGDPVVGVRGLRMRYGDHDVLRGVDFDVHQGILFGSMFRNPRAIAVVGGLLTVGLAMVSGLFFSTDLLWSWIQVVVQAFPIYWLGLGLRSALLPAEAVAAEIGGSWRTVEAIGVLGLWAALGLLLGPVLLRRMARRESGSAVEARRQRALQRA